MTAADRPAFSVELTILADRDARITLTTSLLESYWEDLAEYDFTEIQRAIRAGRKQWRFFPAPGEIAELIREHRRETRRALAERCQQTALPPVTEEERRLTEEARGRFFAFVHSLADRMRPWDQAGLRPLTAEERQDRDRKLARVREQARRLGVAECSAPKIHERS